METYNTIQNLYNTKHKSHFNREIRQKMLTSMKNTLTDNGITATVKQIRKKLTDVKNFYGDQKRMSQSLKSSASGTDDVYASPWKFYKNLELLSEAFTRRKTKSNENDENDGSPYVDTKSSSAKTSKKLALVQNNELHRAMSTTTIAMESVISSKKKKRKVSR